MQWLCYTMVSLRRPSSDWSRAEYQTGPLAEHIAQLGLSEQAIDPLEPDQMADDYFSHIEGPHTPSSWAEVRASLT